MQYNWNEEKNKLLKKTRNISFEEIVEAINDGDIHGKIDHPNAEKYPNQKIYLVEIMNYIYEVPCVISPTEIFIKTAYKSRKFTKIYL